MSLRCDVTSDDMECSRMHEQPGSLFTQAQPCQPDSRGFAHETAKYRHQEMWSSHSKMWNRAVLIFSVVSAGVYVVETYLEQTSTPLWSYVIETVVALFFCIDYGIRIYFAESRIAFALQGSSVLDVLCVLPVIFTYVLAGTDTRARQFVFFLQFLRVARLIRILRGYRAVSVSKRGDPDNLRKQINILIYTLMALIFITAAMLHLVEKYGAMAFVDDHESNPDLAHFHDAVYFVVITLTTVGYGDISPKTTIGRILVMIFVTCSIIIIPRETGKLSELMALTSQYGGVYNPSSSCRTAHVIVCGHLEFGNLRSFLMEFFHEAHGQHNMTVLVLGPCPPSKAVKLLFGQNGLYGSRVKYFEGSALDEDDLERLQYINACAVFFLADRETADPISADSETIMRILSCKNYSSSVPVFAQILLQESKTQAIVAGADYLVCLRELKMHILAVSSVVRGFSTLFCNLFRNESFVYEEAGHWLTEYCHGISYEVYTVRLPQAFVGHSFPEVAYFIYKEFDSLLFGLQRFDPQTKQIQSMLNPVGDTDMLIVPNDTGFVFATDSAVTDLIESFDGDVVTTSMSGIFKPKPCVPDGTFTDLFPAEALEGEAGCGKTKAAENPEPIDVDLPPLIPLVLYGEERAMRDVPALIKQRIRTQTDDLKGHIVIMTPHLNLLLHFLPALRGDRDAGDIPVVALMPRLPPKSQLESLLLFPSVYVVVGSGKGKHDFTQCGISRATCLVIINSGLVAGVPWVTQKDCDNEDMMADFDAVTVFHSLREHAMLTDSVMPFTIVELVSKQNLRFFPPAHDKRVGRVTDMNDYIVPCYASGSVYSDAVMDSLLCQVFYNTDLLRVLNLFLAQGPRIGTFRSSRVYLFPMQPEFHGWTFEQLLAHLVLGGSKMLPIGLYRSTEGAPHPRRGARYGASLVPYVYLCPPADALLREADAIYVLSPDPPESTYRKMYPTQGSAHPSAKPPLNPLRPVRNPYSPKGKR